MNNGAVFRQILDQIQELLDKVVTEHSKIKYPLPPEVLKTMENLEGTLAQMDLLTKPFLKQGSGRSDGQKPYERDDETWQFIQKVREVKRLAMGYRREIETTIKGLIREGATDEEAIKNPVKARKRKFHKAVGHKNWTPI